MAQQIEDLAWFVAETSFERIPEDVRRYAKLVVLDTIGVILAGASRPEVRGLRERLAASVGSGASLLAPGWPQADARTAALLNGIAGRAIELGEGNRYVSYQGAMQILPGVLAVGEAARCSGRDMLAALILGYDACAPPSRRGRWRTRTARPRCSPRWRPARGCAGSTAPASAAPCASPRPS